MHTYTVNKILDLKLSLWQNYIHKIFVPKSKRGELFLFVSDGEQEGGCVFLNKQVWLYIEETRL